MHGGIPDVEAAAPERIVAIRPGALGDALLLFPALALLRHAFPSTRITLVTRRDVLPLVRTSGLADETSPYDDPRWSALFTAQPQAYPDARALLEGATALIWLADPDGGIARAASALGAAQVIVLTPPTVAEGAREHAALCLARALAPLGVELPTSIPALIATMPRLESPEDDLRRADEVWQRLGLAQANNCVVALHPGSGGAAKRWPPERFAALATAIRAMGYQPLLLAGPQDAAIAEVTAAATCGALPIARDLSVGALAALLRRCAAYVGNDSGVSHLAGMLGLPALVLFGPTDPIQWLPLGPHVRMLRAPEGQLERLPAEDVAQALSTMLSD